MAIQANTLSQLQNGSYKLTSLSLCGKSLTDAELEQVLVCLPKNPKLQSLNLRNNQLTNAAAKRLAEYEQLTTTVFLSGNRVTVDGYEAFLQHQTITGLPIRGGGKRVAAIRQHVKDNANKPKEQPEKIEETPVGGQAGFEHLIAVMLADVDTNKTTDRVLLEYLTVLLHYSMHVASHAPAKGYGDVQKREMDAKLQYVRSQSRQNRHPHIKRANDTYKRAGLEYPGIGYGPINTTHQELLRDILSQRVFNQVNRLNEHGFRRQPKAKLNGVGPRIGYSGLRMNNHRASLMALNAYCDVNPKQDLGQVIRGIIAKDFTPKRLKKTPLEQRLERLKYIQQQFAKQPAVSAATRLTPLLMRTRHDQRLLIKKDLPKDFSCLSLEYPMSSTYLILNLYPSFTDKQRDSQLYHDGVTQVLMSFFVALLNDQAHQAGLVILAERRQSFGFFRSTVSDVGSLRIRLSLGVEPAAYAPIVASTIKQFDALLEKYDFTQPKQAVIKQCFSETKRKSGKEYKRAADKKLQTAMRSDEDQWLAINVASKALVSASSKPNRIGNAFESFLKTFIVDRADKVVHTKRKRQLEPEVSPFTANPDKVHPAQPNQPIVSALRHVMKYVQTKIPKFDLSGEYIQQLSGSALHNMEVCWRYLQKAQDLLAQTSRLPADQVYQRANGIIDMLLEHFIALQAIADLSQVDHKLGLKHPFIQKYTDQKQQKIKNHYQIDTPVHTYLTDSGQQSNVLAVIAMAAQMTTKSDIKKSLSRLYITNNCYYEMKLFFSDTTDIQPLTDDDKHKDRLLLMDINEAQETDFSKYKELQVVLFDMTNCPDHSLTNLNQAVEVLRERGVWIVFTESLLKHSQLGLDKHQAGCLTCVPPPGDALDDDVEEILRKDSEAAATPFVARFLQTIHELSATQATPKLAQALAQQGFHNKLPQPTLPVKTPVVAQAG